MCIKSEHYNGEFNVQVFGQNPKMHLISNMLLVCDPVIVYNAFALSLVLHLVYCINKVIGNKNKSLQERIISLVLSPNDTVPLFARVLNFVNSRQNNYKGLVQINRQCHSLLCAVTTLQRIV